jgi:SAM-dependent methyltransferase
MFPIGSGRYCQRCWIERATPAVGFVRATNSSDRMSFDPLDSSGWQSLNPGGAVIPFFQRYDPTHLSRYVLAAHRIPAAATGLYIDYGCGYGYGTAYVASQCPVDCLGIDVDHRCINYARRKYRRSGLRFQLVDSLKLPVRDSSACMISAFDVIEHLSKAQARAFFDEALRALRPDGMLLGTTPNSSLREHVDLVYHRHEFTGIELCEILSQQGFTAEILGLGSSGRQSPGFASQIIEKIPVQLKSTQLLKISQSLLISIQSPRHPAGIEKAEVSTFQPSRSSEILFVAMKRPRSS